MTEDVPYPAEGQFLVYQAEDGRLKIDVRFEGETVWLTQGQMAELFQTSQQNVSLHLQNVYSEGELEREATHKESLLVRQEGARSVQRRVDVYNLDVMFPSVTVSNMATATTERVQKHRTALRESGLHPVQIWVPDTRCAGFAQECQRGHWPFFWD